VPEYLCLEDLWWRMRKLGCVLRHATCYATTAVSSIFCTFADSKGVIDSLLEDNKRARDNQLLWVVHVPQGKLRGPILFLFSTTLPISYTAIVLLFPSRLPPETATTPVKRSGFSSASASLFLFHSSQVLPD
jgi:hypothetical protein